MGEKCKFLPKIRTRQGCLLSPFLVKTVLETLARPVRQIEINKLKKEKEKLELSLFTDNRVLSIEDLKNSTRGFLSISKENEALQLIHAGGKNLPLKLVYIKNLGDTQIVV